MQDYGIRDVFGIPGDFVLQFYGMLQESPIRVIGTRREDCAGYAADGYARINGMGAVCLTYCVGGLSVTNSIAGAYAGEIARDRDQRRSGQSMSAVRIRCCTTASAISTRSGRSSRKSRSLPPCSTIR